MPLSLTVAFRYPSVQANLVECGNLGRYAFLEAENGMGIIQLTSRVMNGKVRRLGANMMLAVESV